MIAVLIICSQPSLKLSFASIGCISPIKLSIPSCVSLYTGNYKLADFSVKNQPDQLGEKVQKWEDGLRTKEKKNQLEWWYFDGMSDNGVWSFVIIFYEGNPFSPRYIHSSSKKEAKPGSYPAISISIYKEGKAEYYSFLEFKWDSFSCNGEDFTIKIGKSGFKRSYENGELQYQLNLDQILASGHSLVGTIEFSSAVFEEAGSSSVKEEMNEQHFWNLLQPMAGVKADFEINGRNGFENVSFNGSGYHDHNTGYEPMKDSFRDWYWGRFHFEKHTLLYYVMNKLNGSRQHEAWLRLLVQDCTRTTPLTQPRAPRPTCSLRRRTPGRCGRLEAKRSRPIATVGASDRRGPTPSKSRTWQVPPKSRKKLSARESPGFVEPERMHSYLRYWHSGQPQILSADPFQD